MKKNQALKYIFFLTIMFTAYSCGQYAGNNNYAGGGIGGTGITGVSVGKITAVDNTSISVNGVEFSLEGANIKVNGNTGDITNLKTGMIVQVDGQFDTTGLTGKALTIEFDNNLEGPVDSNSIDPIDKKFTVLGKNIFVDDTTAFVSENSLSFSFATLAAGNVVEISGFEGVDGSILATYVELKEDHFNQDNNQVELKGTVSSLNKEDNKFVLSSITVTYTDVLPGFPESSLIDGAYVEVKGTINLTNNTLNATNIEIKNMTPSYSEGVKLEIEGVVTEYNSFVFPDDFKVNNQPVHITGSTNFEKGSQADIKLNIELEVKGTISNGVLIASEVSIESVNSGSGSGGTTENVDHENETHIHK